MRVVRIRQYTEWCLTAYFSFKDWMSSLVEAILALISSKTTATFCGLAMVLDTKLWNYFPEAWWSMYWWSIGVHYPNTIFRSHLVDNAVGSATIHQTLSIEKIS